ncbi:hypothetical protein A2U01_0113400, partial [Trifolium medium]|nr:hypothetical protein [Trifolium medium]
FSRLFRFSAGELVAYSGCFPANVMCFGADLEVLGGFGGASMVW